MTNMMDRLMANVTSAVFKAEGAVKDAIMYYEALIKAEQAIVDHAEATTTDKEIAVRGVDNARRMLVGLKGLWASDEGQR
jgi:hypothetical protein